MNLSQRDEKVIWHPYTSAYSPTPIPIVKAEGAYLYTDSGKRIIDFNSSWWVTAHGHCHPYIAQAISQQAHTLEQVIFAGFTHQPAVELAERLLGYFPTLSKVFFSDNGSTAVEVALKMCFQAWYNQGKERKKVIAFEGSYHGDTFGSMAVSERDIFTAAFHTLLFDVDYLPYPTQDNYEQVFEKLEQLCQTNEYASCIVEPLVQGVAGMRITRPEYIAEIWKICKKHNVFTIADEIMTGFGRTGTLFACQQIDVQPDVVCLSKCLTGGFLPLGLTLCTDSVFEHFVTQDRTKTFFHGHSFTGNPIACAAANANLDLFEQEDTQIKLRQLYQNMALLKEELEKCAFLYNIRHIGGILAFELGSPQRHYLNAISTKIRSFYLERNMLVRPLGNTIYIIPP
ncbi:MAG: adenosylmethionine--8-amino-7-oxononanoate transaminase, partial [Bacteroidia bacterium]|nr:adenosylmethionine--8-amino-7-oxononanoate transaminase [Bacteroidia bacterium]